MKDLLDIITKDMPILSAVTDAICITDNSGNTIFSNKSYEKMVKRGSTELIADSNDIKIEDEIVGKVIVYHDTSEVNRLKRELDRLNQKLRKVQVSYSFKDIIGRNPEMQKVINTAQIAAMTPATIMIRGESGTGKEIFANAIHNSSPRRNEKFVKINCASLPEELLESELFGYCEGAFTGARRGGKKGLFQEADKGTLFLDEIGDVSPRMQVKLLRALQEKEILPVGSLESVKVDVRVICATNKPLEDMIEEGTFREDLYYRLNVFPLYIPPLRERKEDIKYIIIYLLNQYNEFYSRNVTDIEEEAIVLLEKQEWRGNVRELENVISRALINMDIDDTVITIKDIELSLNGENRIHHKTNSNGFDDLPQNINEAVLLVEKHCIEKAMEKYQGDKNKAAVELGIPLRTLYYKCNKIGI